MNRCRAPKADGLEDLNPIQRRMNRLPSTR